MQSRLAQKAGARARPVAVVFAAPASPLNEDERSALDRIFDDRPQVVLLVSTKKAPPHWRRRRRRARRSGRGPDRSGAPSAAAPADGAAPAEAAPADAAPAGPATPADEQWFTDIEAEGQGGRAGRP